MKTTKIKHQPLAFALPSAQDLKVISISGKIKTVAQLRFEAHALTRLPAAHEFEDNLQYDAYTGLWNKNFRDLCFAWHTPNGGTRDKVEAMQLKGQGVRRGIPDLMFMTYGKRMVFIELKVGHYRYDPDQALFAHKAFQYGFEDVYICGTLREVAALLCHIFDKDPSTLVFA